MRYAVIILALCLFSCNRSQNDKKATKTLAASTGSYLSSYTQQHIKIDETLQFRFSGIVVDPNTVGQDINQGIFTISPNVKGKAYWKDQSTINFTPEEIMDYDRDYVVNIKLRSLFTELEEDLKEINITYHTKPLDINLNLNQIEYGSDVDQEFLTLTGRLRTNNVINNETVERIFEAKQKGNEELVISWNHYSQTNHAFTIENIVRGHKPSQVNITWDANSICPGSKGQRTLEILPKGAFTFLEANLDPNDKQVIICSFSDRLEANQDLTGLITIKDYKGKLRLEKSGSKIKVFADKKLPSAFTVKIHQSLKRKDGDALSDMHETRLTLEPTLPALELLGKGVIVPSGDEIMFPFMAKNLKSVTIEIFKIYNNNVLQFLQNGQLDNLHSNLNLVGNIIHQQKINLKDYSTSGTEENIRVALNLSHFVQLDPGAVYQVRVAFDQTDIAEYKCQDTDVDPYELSYNLNKSIIQYRYSNYEDRKNPCKSGYYNSEKFIKRNLLASDFGIIAKTDKNNTSTISITDLQSLDPIPNAEVKFYSLQQQIIKTGFTDSQGQVTSTLDQKAHFAIVKNNNTYGYINMQDRHANSLSEFKVSGRVKQSGIDGLIYGERGVWRPGDTMFLNFMLEDNMDKIHSLPNDHPVKFEVTDSRSKVKYTQTNAIHLGHIFHYPIPTLSTDPTGNWRATATVGNQVFTKTLKVETVKPNRLKIEFEIPDDRLDIGLDKTIALRSQWLHGANAQGLKAKVDMQLSSVATKFATYGTYIFDDPARKVSPVPATIYEGNLDAEGQSEIKIKRRKDWQPPGKLKALLTTRVYEKSGNFSEDNVKVDADIYNSYVGIDIPKTRWGSHFIPENEPTDIKVITLDKEGKPISNRNLKVGIYKARWNWWYDKSHSGKYKYNSSTHNGALLKDSMKSNSNGEANYSVNLDGYGNYLIRICDEESGHCTGGMFYTGRNWSQQDGRQGPQLLNFTSDKDEYETGENIKLKIPSNLGAKIFVSIENGEEVIKSFWVDAKKDLTEINLPTTRDMNPNIYVYATLVQKHNQKNNDLPLRMYGVLPIKVVDKNTLLSPKIDIKKELRPDEYFDIKVSEDSGKEMYYTLAVVDEGLLSLTRYNTPNTWAHFYAKQALGIKTWDIYDQVLTGYGDNIDKIISIGGDSDGANQIKPAKANRFKPVVQHLGPFRLKAGAKKVHKIKIDNYVGAIRAMVVARHEDKYGRTAETAYIKKPLMVQATLPRVLGPGETLGVPANVFAMADNIRNVNVTINTDDLITLTESNSKDIQFSQQGDQLSTFNIKVGDQTGPTKVSVSVQSGKESSKEEIDIEVRNPNPVISKVQEKSIPTGSDWNASYTLFGTEGTNRGVIEVSNMLPMNLEKRLGYLVRYPYGCIEQTTSSVFPQLYLSDLMDLSPIKLNEIEKNIQKGIERLSLFQTSNGGLSYWPGNPGTNSWGSAYAFHFLIEAKDKGYFIPSSMLTRLTNYLSKESDKYVAKKVKYNNYKQPIEQAYTLYLLALAGEPNLSAMNRLRNFKELNVASSHLLAAAYAKISKKDIAHKLIANTDINIEPYIETGYTYGSQLRDQAIIVEALMAIGNDADALSVVNQISKEMNTNNWHSTQSTAFALLSAGKFIIKNPKDKIDFVWTKDSGPPQTVTSEKSIKLIDVDVESGNSNSIYIKNNSKGFLYAKLIISGQEPPGQGSSASSKHLTMTTKFKDMEGHIIDPSTLRQGTDFIAEVELKNLGTKGWNIEEMALSQIFPSGWEIQNTRLAGKQSVAKESDYEYRDIRDDRVNTFFDIKGKNKLTYITQLTATFAGRFYLPAWYTEAMYDNEIQAISSGSWVEVTNH